MAQHSQCHIINHLFPFALSISDYMDGPSTCGQTIIIYDNIINLAARSPISTPNPPRICTTMLRSGYTDSYYYIKIEWTATIKDCAFALNIYEGSSPSGAPIVSSQTPPLTFTSHRIPVPVLSRSLELLVCYRS